MCRLFGLYANVPVNVTFSFYEARTSMYELSRRNPDGWAVSVFIIICNIHIYWCLRSLRVVEYVGVV